MPEFVRDHSLRELDEGEFFSTGFRFTDVSSKGGSVGVVLENNNSFSVFLPVITLRSGFRGRVEKGFNPTIDTSDSNLDFINKKSDASDAVSNMNAFTVGDGQTGAITTDGDNFNDKHLAAGTATSPGTQAEIGGNILAPNDSMFVLAVNESSNSGDVSIDIDFIKMNQR